MRIFPSREPAPPPTPLEAWMVQVEDTWAHSYTLDTDSIWTDKTMAEGRRDQMNDEKLERHRAQFGLLHDDEFRPDEVFVVHIRINTSEMHFPRERVEVNPTHKRV